MADIETFRRRVGYRPTVSQDMFTGNELRKTFQLSFENVSDVSVSEAAGAVSSDTYSVDAEAGTVTFTTAPDNNAAITIVYKYAAFTDAEAEALIAEYGLERAVIEALREILANQARLRNYKEADTEVDNSQVFKQVRELIRMYEDEYQSNRSAETGVIVQRRNDPRASSECREQDISRLYG